MRCSSATIGVAAGDGALSVFGPLLADFERTSRLLAAPKQARAQVAIVQRFLWGQGIAEAGQITTATIEAYLGLVGQRLSDKTLLNHLSALRRFCQFLRRRGLLGDDPTAGIRLRMPERLLPRYLGADDLAAVLQIARDEGIWPEVCLALSTGLRLSEMIRLRWEDIDWKRRCLLVRKSKSRRPRLVPLCRSAVVALRFQRRRAGTFLHVFPARQTWRNHWHFVDKPRASNWWRRAIKPIQDAVPIFRSLPGSATGRGWHLFRHTFASRAAQAGVSLYKLAQWLGHADVRTTQRYAHLQVGFDKQIEAASPIDRPEKPWRRGSGPVE